MGILAVILTSFFGSVHCAGMCGGFAIMCSTGTGKVMRSILGYHLGRLNTYLLLGAVAGALGSSLRHLGALAGVHYLSSVVLGTFLVATGLAALFGVRLIPAQWLSSSSPGEALVPLVRRSRTFQDPLFRSFVLGATTTLLPCGWLYSFVALAATTGKIADGAIVMFAFWLGSIPALAATGVLGHATGSAFSRFAPKLTAFAVIAAGFLCLVQHDFLLLPGSSGETSCHH